MTTLGVLHPGKMGVTLAAAAATKSTVIWAGENRSSASRSRAAEAGLSDAGSVTDLCQASDVVLSICPPAAALDVARQVAATGFDGKYVDANAVAPATADHIRSLVTNYIDGSVIGPPANTAGTTRMYLAGPGAEELAELWAGSALDVRTLSESAEGGPASALKMAYAGWTKGQAALLLTVTALGESAGVLDALRDEWDISQPGLGERARRTAGSVGQKAWRFSGEMAEIADTMAAAGLPDGFHRAAEDLYQRMAVFKDVEDVSLEQVITQVCDE